MHVSMYTIFIERSIHTLLDFKADFFMTNVSGSLSGRDLVELPFVFQENVKAGMKQYSHI